MPTRKTIKSAKKPAPKNTAKTTGSRTKVASPKKTAPPRDSTIVFEVLALIAIGFGLLLIIGMFTTWGGTVLTAIAGILRGLFGIGAYAMPFLIIALSVYYMASQDKYFNVRTTVMCGALFFIIISFAHVLSYKAPNYNTLTEYLMSCFTNGGITNGGFFGAIFGNFLYLLLGAVGTYLVLGIAAASLIILITGKSLFSAVMGLTESAVAKISDMRDEAMESRAMRAAAVKKNAKENPPEATRTQRVFNHTVAEEESDEEIDEIDLIGERIRKAREQAAMHELLDPEPPPVATFPEFIKRREPMRRGIVKPSSATIVEPVIKTAYEPEIICDTDFADELGATEDVPTMAFDASRHAAAGILLGAESDAPFDDYTSDYIEEIPYTPQPLPYPTPPTATEQPQKLETIDPDNDSDICFIGFDDEIAVTSTPTRPMVTAVQTPEPQTVTPVAAVAPAPLKPTPPPQTDVFSSLTTEIEEPAEYVFPPVELLNDYSSAPSVETKAHIIETSKKLEETLRSFGVEARVVEVSRGPTVTRYELSPGQGVRVSKISNLSDDIALNLAATSVRIEAPVPGKPVIGIEIPNRDPQMVSLREVLDSQAFSKSKSNVAFAVGKDIAGEVVVADIAAMPHLLIAGSTGSGKSVCVNTLITSIIYKSTPNQVRFIMIDPKVVELNMYNGIPHLLIPVVTDPKQAAKALNWGVREMERRYQEFATNNVKNCAGYNEYMAEIGSDAVMPQIIIIIDELADLMMTAEKSVEDSISRLAQMARAAGIHLVIATQRPSVDVITGKIKANVPSRMAFAVSSGIDSRTILDAYGAENLLGKGDMLFHPLGSLKPLRIQGAFISAKEIESIVAYIKENNTVQYDTTIESEVITSEDSDFDESGTDEFFFEAVEFILEKDKASASLLQRRFRIGYNRAARLIEELESRGIVGPDEGASKPRKILIKPYEWEQMKRRK